MQKQRTIVPTAFMLAALLVLGLSAGVEAAHGQTLRPQRPVLFSPGFIPVEVWRVVGPAYVEVGEPAVFTAEANVEKASLPLECHWNFGDGGTASSLAATHRFRKPGTYRVSFTLSNARSADTAFLEVVVAEPGQAPHPDPASGRRTRLLR